MSKIVAIGRSCAMEQLMATVQVACTGLMALPYDPAVRVTVADICESLTMAVHGANRADAWPAAGSALMEEAAHRLNATMAQIGAEMMPKPDLTRACPDCGAELADGTAVFPPNGCGKSARVPLTFCANCGYSCEREEADPCDF